MSELGGRSQEILDHNPDGHGESTYGNSSGPAPYEDSWPDDESDWGESWADEDELPPVEPEVHESWADDNGPTFYTLPETPKASKSREYNFDPEPPFTWSELHGDPDAPETMRDSLLSNAVGNEAVSQVVEPVADPSDPRELARMEAFWKDQYDHLDLV